MIPGAFVIPIALVWYGWSADKGVQFIMPIVGTTWFGLGLMMIFMPISMYLIDFYSKFKSRTETNSRRLMIFKVFTQLQHLLLRQ